MPAKTTKRGEDAGFSVLELLLVVLIVGLLTGAGILIATNVLPTMRADSTMQMVVSQLRLARQQAMDQRRAYQVSFPTADRVVVTRQEIGATATSVTVADYILPYGMMFMLLDGVADTPDGFGNTQPVNFNGRRTVVFLSDGSAVDTNGAVVNGGVFMAIPQRVLTARAITVMGATGRIRAYRYDGTAFRYR